MIPAGRLEGYRARLRAAFAAAPGRSADDHDEDRQFFASWRARIARDAGTTVQTARADARADADAAARAIARTGIAAGEKAERNVH